MPNHRKSKEEKQLAGTYRKDRDKATLAGARITEAPEPPDTLSNGARQEWKSLAPVLVELGTICRGDLRAFEQLCETLATANALQAVIATEGILLKMGNGSYKTNPAQKSLEVARNQAKALYTEFGLTPKARSYVSAAPKEAEYDPYSRESLESDGFQMLNRGFQPGPR